eukprot:symbB.v1.2.035672.t1/scaffold4858.1/size33832/4
MFHSHWQPPAIGPWIGPWRRGRFPDACLKTCRPRLSLQNWLSDFAASGVCTSRFGRHGIGFENGWTHWCPAGSGYVHGWHATGRAPPWLLAFGTKHRAGLQKRWGQSAC